MNILTLRENLKLDFAANRNYPKSKVVLASLRVTQFARELPGPVGSVSRVILGSLHKLLTEWMLGVELPPSTKVGPGLRLRHGIGTVVNPNTIIGRNVMIRQGVTLGNRVGIDDCPQIGDDVEIGAGAVVIGAVSIGQGARIGPNAVVVKDVPAETVVYSPSSFQREAL